MIKLKTNEAKELEFNVATTGVMCQDLCGHVRFCIDEVEYGFPLKVMTDKVYAQIPPLNEFVKVGLENGKNFEARLEIIANETFICPWTEQMVIEMPVNVTVEAVKDTKKIKEIIEAAKESVKVNSPKITTISTAEQNPIPFDKVLKTAKQEADKKAKETTRRERKKEKTKLGSVLMGGE